MMTQKAIVLFLSFAIFLVSVDLAITSFPQPYPVPVQIRHATHATRGGITFNSIAIYLA